MQEGHCDAHPQLSSLRELPKIATRNPIGHQQGEEADLVTRGLVQVKAKVTQRLVEALPRHYFLRTTWNG